MDEMGLCLADITVWVNGEDVMVRVKWCRRNGAGHGWGVMV